MKQTSFQSGLGHPMKRIFKLLLRSRARRCWPSEITQFRLYVKLISFFTSKSCINAQWDQLGLVYLTTQCMQFAQRLYGKEPSMNDHNWIAV